MTRGQRGREIGRGMIAIACLAIGLTLFGFLAVPQGLSPMFSSPPDFLGLPAGTVVTLTGIVGVVVGLIWMIRIYRADQEPDQHAWRYRSRDTQGAARWSIDRAAGPMQVIPAIVGGVVFGTGMTRGQRGRWIGRGMIGLAIVMIGSAVVWLIAAPGFIGSPPMGYGPRVGPVPADVVMLLIGFAGPAIGLVWMIRIHRADPEPDQRAWRYRARDR